MSETQMMRQSEFKKKYNPITGKFTKQHNTAAVFTMEKE